MEQIFQIPVYKINEAHKHLVKLQKRAGKMGLNVFTFKFGEEIKTHGFQITTDDGDTFVSRYDYKELTVAQDITVHEGWTPIAKLDIGEKSIRSYATYDSEMEKIGEDRMWSKKCDHCGHSKTKHTAFILQNGNEFMKVGSGCMRELAPANALKIAKEFDVYAMWSKYLNDLAKAGKEEGMNGGGRGFGGGVHVDQVYDKSQLILAMRVALERTDGKWVTSHYSDDRNPVIINKGSRTFDYIGSALNKQYLSLLPDDKYVKSINDQVTLVLEKYSASIKTPESLEALKVFHAASKAKLLDVFFIKTVQGIIVREERNKLNGHFFTDGQKVELEIKEIASAGYQGAYGYVSIKTYLTKDGQIVKYVGSSPITFELPVSKERVAYDKAYMKIAKEPYQSDEQHSEKITRMRQFAEDNLDRIEQLESVRTLPEYWKVKGTVKHTDYKGVKETHLQRMKLI